MGEPTHIEYRWTLENFCFCDLYCNERLESPSFIVRTPGPSEWSLYMFPNGLGMSGDQGRYIGVYLQRKEDNGPEEISVRFKIYLLGNDGILYPEVSEMDEFNFTKNSDWGYNKFISRRDIATGSLFLCKDALRVVCRIEIIDSEQIPRRQQYSEREEIEKISNALQIMYEEKLYSDMELKASNNKTLKIHRCILKSRLPDLYIHLQASPNTEFSDDFVTKKILSYAYSGILNIDDIDPSKVKTTLQEYQLLQLEKNLFSQCNKYVALTYFHLKKSICIWKISASLFNTKEEIYSQIIPNEQKSEFQMYLYRSNDTWRIMIKHSSSSNDDIFIRCKIFVKDFADEIRVTSWEGLCKSHKWWFCETSLRLVNNSIWVNDEAFSINNGITLKFVFFYPSGKVQSDLEAESYHSCTADSDRLTDSWLKDLEDLYYNQQETDLTIVAGNREFKVHKCIVSARSPFFRALLRHDMPENENEIHLMRGTQDERIFQEVIDKLLLFTYCGKFDARSPTFATLLLEAIDMYMIGADHYRD